MAVLGEAKSRLLFENALDYQLAYPYSEGIACDGDPHIKPNFMIILHHENDSYPFADHCCTYPAVLLQQLRDDFHSAAAQPRYHRHHHHE